MNKAGARPPGLTASPGDETGRHLIRISAKRAEMHEQQTLGSRCRI